MTFPSNIDDSPGLKGYIHTSAYVGISVMPRYNSSLRHISVIAFSLSFFLLAARGMLVFFPTFFLRQSFLDRIDEGRNDEEGGQTRNQASKGIKREETSCSGGGGSVSSLSPSSSLNERSLFPSSSSSSSLNLNSEITLIRGRRRRGGKRGGKKVVGRINCSNQA